MKGSKFCKETKENGFGTQALRICSLMLDHLSNYNYFRKKPKNVSRWRSEMVHQLMAEQRGGDGRQGIIFSYERTWQEQRRCHRPPPYL